MFSDRIIVLSKRPTQIKNIIDINCQNNSSIYERRKDKNFHYYFDLIWKDIDKNE